MSRVTVIVPVYNGADHLLRCLESLRGQTYQAFDILAINDGSKDRSQEILESFQASFQAERIRVVSRENRGVANTRNEGIELADTEYIAFVDQDDFLAADYLETYVAAMDRDQADMVCGGYLRYDPVRKRTLRRVSPVDGPFARYVVTAPWAHLFRTAFLDEHPEIRFLDTALGEDVYFTMMGYAATARVTTIAYDGYYWVDNPRSHSNAHQKTIQKGIDPFILLDALEAHLPSPGAIDGETLAYFMFRYVVWYLLYTVRQSSVEEVGKQYRKLMAWLQAHYPGFERNRMISLFGPKGEPVPIRASVWTFRALYRCGLILPVLRCLARREKGTRKTSETGDRK